MKKANFIWENRYIVIPVFLWIGVYFDYAHLYLYFPSEYVGIAYGVEINFSQILQVLIYKIKLIIGV